MTASDDLSPSKRLLLQEVLQAGRRHRPHAQIAPRPQEAIPPISAEQYNVWLHAAIAGDVPIYNEAITIHRKGSFDFVAIEKSFNEILRRHEAWRTSFTMIDGTLRQIVHPEITIPLELDDLTSLPAGERENISLSLATADARRPFDLARVPLLRVRVVRLAPDTHRLYVTLHHIIFDGVSIYRVIMPEFAALYAAFARGCPPRISESRLQYGDYAIWREQQLKTDSITWGLAYWREQLAGELPRLRLPADRSPRAVPTYRGNMEVFQVLPSLTGSLKALSRQEGVTLYVALLAAFKALLYRYSGQDDIVVGGVTDMRRRPELEKTVGYFLNSLALRTKPSDELSFRDYLIQVRDVVVSALDASIVPFDRVVREVQPTRFAAQHPLFQVLFSIEPPASGFGEGWDLTQMDVVMGAAKFDLYLELDERAGGIIGRFLYSTDIFDAPRIRRMIDHWRTLLESIVDNPKATVGSLPLLTQRERHELLVLRNTAGRDCPNITLHAWFSHQVQRRPNAAAIEFQGRTWSYRDLDRRVKELAVALRKAGAGRETLVAIALDRSFDMVAGLLAILTTGAAYLPVDGYLPPARLETLVEDARPAIFLTERTLFGRLPRSEARIVLCDDVPMVTGTMAGAFNDSADPDSLAYVLYTSGSTGRPKGVEVTHRSIVNLLSSVERDPGFGGRDRLLAVTTISFDIAALELFLPLVTGGCVVLAAREDTADPARLGTLLRQSNCTMMQATPAMWRGLIGSGWVGAPNMKILCGGEVLAGNLAAELLNRSAGVWNMYGPSETTVWSLQHKVAVGSDPVPIGTPIANTKAYVLDLNGCLVPAGVAGELCIGGVGLARGYRNDPTQTRQKFVSFPALPGERLYRTGDIARCRTDGVVEFIGRKDNQVKVRGFRVALEEIECIIGTYPEVALAAVRAWPDASEETSLTAFVVGKVGPINDFSGLRRFLRQVLPGYMVPAHFVALRSMPMTATGKIDRKQLTESRPNARRTRVRVAPRDELERSIAAVWEEVLGSSDVDIHDNFFDAGGHSLLGVTLLAGITKAVGRQLSLATLLRAPTIAALAEQLKAVNEFSFSHLVELRAGSGEQPLFIVHAIFGSVVKFRALAERLCTDRPVYGVQARGMDPNQEPHASIAEMADAYIDAIRTLQPAGPYALAGYSFGGLVAYEMACRLAEGGQKVEFLALFDADLHPRNLPMSAWLAYHWSLVRRVSRKLRRMPARDCPAYLHARIVAFWVRFLRRTGLRNYGDPSNEITGALSARAVQMYQIGVREFTAFRPRRYGGNLSTFRTTEPRFDVCDPLPAWRRLVSSMDVHAIAGPHIAVMDEPYVGAAASSLSQCLAKLDAGKVNRVPPPSPPRIK